MTEPTTFAAVVVTAISAVTMSMLGIDYYGLVWALLGALYNVYNRQSADSKTRTTAFVVLSTIIGAGLGMAAASVLAITVKIVASVCCLIGGYAIQQILDSLKKAASARIEQSGGADK